MDINFSKSFPKAPQAKLSLKKPTTLAEFLILLMIVVLFYFFVVNPKSAQVTELKASLETLRNESEELTQQQGKLNSLIRQMDVSAQDVAKLDDSLPLHPRPTWAYMLLDNLVQSSGMTVGSLNVNNVNEEIMAADSSLIDNPYSATRVIKKMAVNLSVTGTFVQFQALLKKLENSSRIVDIKALEISASSDELLDFRMSFDTYYFAPESK